MHSCSERSIPGSGRTAPQLWDILVLAYAVVFADTSLHLWETPSVSQANLVCLLLWQEKRKPAAAQTMLRCLIQLSFPIPCVSVFLQASALKHLPN